MAGSPPSADGGSDASEDDHDRFARMDADRELIQQLQGGTFSDHEWDRAAGRLAQVAHGRLIAWLASGEIFRQVAATTQIRLYSPTPPFDEDEIAELVENMVLSALSALRCEGTSCYDPTRGASLDTYFLRLCIVQFPNAFRAVRRRRGRHLDVDPHGLDALQHVAGRREFEPEGATDLKEFGRTLFGFASTETARRVMQLKALGYTDRQIATELGLGDARAVQNMVTHQRRRWRNRKQDAS